MNREAWERLRVSLKARVGSDTYDAWFARLEFAGCADGVVTLTVPTRFLRQWLAHHYADLLTELWQGVDPRLRVSIGQRLPGRPLQKHEVQTLGTAEPAAEVSPKRMLEAEFRFASKLDPQKIFASFCQADGNRVAYAAALSASNPTGHRFNPLFIHGPGGSGKSHLLQAMVAASGMQRVLYMTGERFIYGLSVDARAVGPQSFRKELDDADVLVIDGIQHLAGKLVHQEFRRILAEMLEDGRQLVLSADRPPWELESMEEHVRARLSAGLVLELPSLTERLRLDILRMRAAALRDQYRGFELSDEVAAFVAKNIGSNGRAIDGALNRLLAHSQLNDAPITLETVEEALRDLLHPTELKKTRMDDIMRMVATHYNVTRGDIISQRRQANVVLPRHMVAYLARMLTPRSLPEIGRRMGGRDHTTTLNSVRRVEMLMARDERIADDVRTLTLALTGEVAA